MRVDCQAVVSGFAKSETIAEDHKNLYAGTLRIVRRVIEENGCRITVRKIKAHRLEEDIVDENKVG